MRLKWMCVLVLGVASAVAQENPGTITGTVVDELGAPVPDATVTVVSPGALKTETDTAGKFVITRVSPGAYTVRIQLRGFVIKDLEVSVEAGKKLLWRRVTLEAGVPIPCIADAQRPGISERKLTDGSNPRVRGTARVETGVALRDLTITLLLVGTSTVIATTHTGNNGEFQFVDPAPGAYDLNVSSQGFKLTKVRRLRVRKDHELEVRLNWTQPQFCL